MQAIDAASKLKLNGKGQEKLDKLKREKADLESAEATVSSAYSHAVAYAPAVAYSPTPAAAYAPGAAFAQPMPYTGYTPGYVASPTAQQQAGVLATPLVTASPGQLDS